MKFRSCLTLFHLAAPDEPLFIEALQRYFGGRPDPDTLRLVAGAGDARRSSGPMPLRGADRLRREAQGDPMKPEQLEKWKKIRAKGMLRYVLLGGVVSYGLPMFVIMTFVVNRDRLAEGHVGISAIAWTIGGALFGLAMWFVQERQFRKAGGSGNAP